MKKYDIFISYRRSSYETANLIATRLKAAGYSVFFDMETLRSGMFNVQLHDVIDGCTDFVLVLPPGALDRCVNEDDWVRQEVCRAMAAKKNIIPVMLNGFVWPSPMPTGMEDLNLYNGLSANSIEFFDLAMDRLMQRYLRSKRQVPFRRLLKSASVILLSILAVVAIAWGVFVVLSKDVCQKYATAIANDASHVHIIAEEGVALKLEWEEFEDFLKYETRKDRIVHVKQEMMDRINLAESNVSKSWNVDSVAWDVSPYQSFLLSLHGINAEEIAISPVFANLYFSEYLGQLETMRTAVESPDALNLRFVKALFEAAEHSINSYYASVLSELSAFPKSSRTTYDELYGKWNRYPNYALDQNREYYEGIINKESDLASEALSRFESILTYEDAQLDDLQRQNDELEKILTERGAASSAVQDNDQKLAMHKERVEAKEQLLEATKSELEELDRQYIEVYEALKKKCTLEEADDQWYKWGKIRRWGSYLSMLVQSRQELKDAGLYSTSSITPEVAYADMTTLLRVYQTYHPESASYVAAAKEFYHKVSKAERAYAGVVIFAFKDNAEHPFFKQGDIITAYNGNSIKSYEDLKSAFKTRKDGNVTYIRLQDGLFEEFTEILTDTDIIGFLDLTE